jgi:hypothetical protein
MNNTHVLYLLFLAFYIVCIHKLNATEVIWDNSKDIIYYDGKLYYPEQEGKNISGSEIITNHQSNNISEKESIEETEEEEYASGGEFWICILMILSILNKKFTFF